MSKNLNVVLAILSLMFLTSCADASYDSSTKKIYAQEGVLQAGDRLAEQGLYEEALKKYDEALAPQYISREADTSGPHTRKFRLYRIMGLYQEAQLELDKSLVASNALAEVDEKAELRALIKFSETGDSKDVEEYIGHIRTTQQSILPPRAYFTSASEFWVATILRLYDTIGDHDAGMAFVDEIVEYLYSKHPEMKRAGTLEETTVKADSKSQTRDPNWRGYRIIREYLLVREAFELDKKEGTKGRATKALIQSDYFPW